MSFSVGHFVCSRLKHLLPLGFPKQLIYTNNGPKYFHENHQKSGYETKDTVSSLIRIQEGFKELRNEVKLWTEEVKDRIGNDPIFIINTGETDIVWKFDSEDVLKRWIVTSDRDHSEGHSWSHLTLSSTGRGNFHGHVNTDPILDGRTKKAGYCNMRCMRPRKSFKRDGYFDWMLYNKLVLRVRGDGRPYLINLTSIGYFDVMWNDIHNYILYTRGGPYWQVTKIPFSKFLLSAKGRVQDKQSAVCLDRITHVGITAGRIDGPFNLEIDYIGVEMDPEHTEEFAYEMYALPQYYANY